jgi:hypothetical protein
MSNMTLRRLGSLTYMSAAKMLKGKGQKVIANNTWLVRPMWPMVGEYIAIRHHKTEIVRLWWDGRVTLHIGAWHTRTTHDRVNALTSCRIYTRRGEVFLFVNGISFPYRDGVEVSEASRRLPFETVLGIMQNGPAEARALAEMATCGDNVALVALCDWLEENGVSN